MAWSRLSRFRGSMSWAVSEYTAFLTKLGINKWAWVLLIDCRWPIRVGLISSELALQVCSRADKGTSIPGGRACALGGAGRDSLEILVDGTFATPRASPVHQAPPNWRNLLWSSSPSNGQWDSASNQDSSLDSNQGRSWTWSSDWNGSNLHNCRC